jgi:phosphoribosylanthranilate isomerase
MSFSVKICGLTTAEGVSAALEGGADFLGFVFCSPSPRHLSIDAALKLARPARRKATIVAVTVDATDADIDDLMAGFQPDLIQLHGSEPWGRVRELKNRGLNIIKALPVSEAADFKAAGAYSDADFLLFDAKPPQGADRTGGHGIAFDWTLLQGRKFAQPWFLSGGLDPVNVAAAIARSGASLLDVSSGVEGQKGVKDPLKVRAFLSAAKSASS